MYQDTTMFTRGRPTRYSGVQLIIFLDENLGVPQSSQISHSGSTLTRTQSTDSGIIPPMLGSNKKRDVSHDSKKKKANGEAWK